MEAIGRIHIPIMDEDSTENDSRSSVSSMHSNRIYDSEDEDYEDDDFLDFAIVSMLAEEIASGTQQPKKWGGSQPGKAPNKKRDFQAAADRLIKQYFSGDASVYSEVDFERRFRMERCIFQKIYTAVAGESIFVHRYDCTNKPGVHPIVRITACLRILMYGNCADAYDEKFEIAESKLVASVKAFALKIIEKFGAMYLNRSPTEEELERIRRINLGRGFPGLVASWDCKHFVWKNCPVYLAGQHTGKEKAPTLILEAICVPDLFIYYSFFGSPGSLNDINILDKSSIVSALLSRQFDLKTNEYTINDNVRDWLLLEGYP